MRRALCLLLLAGVLLVQQPARAGGFPLHHGRAKAAAPEADKVPARAEALSLSDVAGIRSQRQARFRAMLQRASNIAAAASGGPLLEVPLHRPIPRSHALSLLPPEPTPNPSGSEAARRRQPNSPGDGSTGGNASGPDFVSGASRAPASDAQVEIIAANPVSDAVRRVCGDGATVCGVWWPTALGNQHEYDSCMQQHAGAQSDLEFGQSPNELCSALWAGDCEVLREQHGRAADLCALVTGNGVQWTSRYDFGDFVTWGDCGFYSTIDRREENIVGIQLKDAPLFTRLPEDAKSVPLKVCAGRLYLFSAR